MSNKHDFPHSHFAAACDVFTGRYNISQLAREIGMSSGVLHNKFDPANEKHKISALDLIALYHATGDDILFDGLMLDCGLTAVRLPSPDAVIPPEARAMQSLNAGASIMGVTAQAAQVLSGDRVTKGHRNALMGGLLAGVEHLLVQAIEVEHKFHSVPTLACAADIARAAMGA